MFIKPWIATSESVYQVVCGISILLGPDQSLFKMSKSSQVLHISIWEHVNKLKMQHVWLCLAFVVLWMLNLHFHSNQNVPLPNFSGYIKKLDDEEHGRFMMSRNTSKSFTDIWDHFSGYWNSTMAFSQIIQPIWKCTFLPCLALPSISHCGILISRMILKSPYQLEIKNNVNWCYDLTFWAPRHL